MKKYFTLKNIAGIAIFTALAAILYCVPGFQFHLGFTPEFLKLHFDEIPVLISSFAYGPVVGVIVLLLKSLIKLPMDMGNFGIGVLADLFYGVFLVVPASIIYKRIHTFKGALIGITVGFLSNVIISSIVGLYTIFPLYGIVYGENFVWQQFWLLDHSITSLYSFKISYEFLLPFNLIRASIVCAVTLLTYKPLKNLINRDYN